MPNKYSDQTHFAMKNFILANFTGSQISNLLLGVSVPLHLREFARHESKMTVLNRSFNWLVGEPDKLDMLFREIIKQKSSSFFKPFHDSYGELTSPQTTTDLLDRLKDDGYEVENGEIISIGDIPNLYKENIPEPELSTSLYRDILRCLYNSGITIERQLIYKNKSEEELRDIFLVGLSYLTEIMSATGETINKNGKTDILIRRNNSNIFIAECKFWSSRNQYLDTISQLFSYLTSRDVKAAVLIFVKNQNHSSVLKQIKDLTSAHPNFTAFIDERAETWLNYRFHADGDPESNIKLAVLLFHFPSKN